MADFGLLETGFRRKTLAEIKASLEEKMRAQISPHIDLSSDSPEGQFVGIFAEGASECWELAEAVENAGHPDGAIKFSLTNLAAITGTTRRGATRSTLTALVNLQPSTTLPEGSIASVDGNPTARFRTTEEVTAPAGPDAFFILAVDMESEETGAVEAAALTLTVIETPVAGWTAITNPDDAELGSAEEEDDDLRLRREAELRAAGGGTVEAIRADLLQLEVDGLAVIAQARVFENVTDTTDADGLPGHSFEAVVHAPGSTVVSPDAATDTAVGELLWAKKPAGIQAYGTTVTSVVTGGDGLPHTVKWTKATPRDIYIELDISIDSDLYPADGDDQVKAAVAAYGDTHNQMGGDVIRRRIEAVAMSIPGVIDITATRLGFSASPVGTTNLTIGLRELARFSSANVDITTAEFVDT